LIKALVGLLESSFFSVDFAEETDIRASSACGNRKCRMHLPIENGADALAKVTGENLNECELN